MLRILTISLLLTPHISLAGWTLSNPTPKGGLTLQDFILMLLNIVQLVATPVLAVCLIWGGYLLVSASGNEEQITRGKLWVLWSIVGAAIILGAKVLADVLFNTAALF